MKKTSLLIFDNKLAYLYTNQNIQTGGIAVEWLHWIKGFNEIGVNIGLLTVEGFKQKILKKINFEIIETYDQNKGIRYLRYFYYRLPKLFFAIKKFDPDYIAQAGTKKEIILLAIISKILQKTFIHRISSDADVDERIKDKLSVREYLAYRLGVKLSDCIYCQNVYQYETLKLKYPNKRLAILKNPYNIISGINILSRQERSYIAWVGSFSRVKNMSALLTVAIKCNKVQFKIAGIQYNSTDPETLKTIELLRKQKNVEFVGYVQNEDIYDFFQRAYALLNTSLLEGFSNTFLEALSVGTPIISTKNVDPDGIILNYKLGMIADSFDQLSDKVDELIKLPEFEYEKLSERCRKYIHENHSSKDLALNFIDIASNLRNS